MCSNSGISTDDLVQGARVGGSISANTMDDDQARQAADPLGLFNKGPKPPKRRKPPEPPNPDTFMMARQKQRKSERSRQGRQSTILTSPSNQYQNGSILGS